MGLSIADSLVADDGRNAFARQGILLSSESKNTLFGPKTRPEPSNFDTDISSLVGTIALSGKFPLFVIHINAPLLNSPDVVFEIGDAPLDPDPFRKTRSCAMDNCFNVIYHHQLIGESPKSTNLFIPTVASKDGFIESLSSSDIELSGDYTCVTMHGSTPKITHIDGDCILECYSSDELLSGSTRKVKEDMQTRTKAPASYPRINFLSSCYACNKLLEESKDIYIYRFPTNTLCPQ